MRYCSEYYHTIFTGYFNMLGMNNSRSKNSVEPHDVVIFSHHMYVGKHVEVYDAALVGSFGSHS